ncbi:MAG: hypothetical protein ACK50N_02065 [Flavobacteriales bacterium]
MKHTEALERFQQAHNASISKLFWIAGSFQESDLRDFIEEMSEDQFKSCFPRIANSKYYQEYRDDGELLEAMVDSTYLGLLAEVLIPEATDFQFEKGTREPVSWSKGIVSRIVICYGDNLESLLKSIEKKAEAYFQECIDKCLSEGEEE